MVEIAGIVKSELFHLIDMSVARAVEREYVPRSHKIMTTAEVVTPAEYGEAIGN